MTSRSSEDSLIIATATYNEASNIDEWITRVRGAHPRAFILVVDDNSPDGTAEIVRTRSEKDVRLFLIVREEKLGIGSAHRLMMVYALEHSFSFLVTLDADLSHQPEEISLLLAELEQNDFVVGTRAGAGQSEYRGLRRLISVTGNRAARTLVPTGLTEYTTSMRAFRREALEALLAFGVRDDAYAFFLECVVALHRCRLRMSEVPIRFLDRTRGKSKLPKSQIFYSALSLVRLSLHRHST